MIYELRCQRCGCTSRDSHFLPIGSTSHQPCQNCGNMMQRVASSFSFHAGIAEHYNATVGKHVKSQQQFNDELNRAADRQSEATGLEHEYAPVDLSDPAACGVVDPHGDAEPGTNHDARRDQGAEAWTDA